jgi:hypothetical protein
VDKARAFSFLNPTVRAALRKLLTLWPGGCSQPHIVIGKRPKNSKLNKSAPVIVYKMESSSLTTTTLTPATEIDAASIVPVVAQTPDPSSIPIAPPHGSPPPPPGQLLPDVAAAEEISSPMKVNTPPPETPSPAQMTEQPIAEQPTPAADVYPNPNQDLDPDQTLTQAAPEAVYGEPALDLAFTQPNEPVFKTERDGDIIMQDHQESHAPNGVKEENGIHTEDSPHVIYPNSPGAFAVGQEDDYYDGPPPAKRQKLESVSKQPCTSHVMSIDTALSPAISLLWRTEPAIHQMQVFLWIRQ